LTSLFLTEGHVVSRVFFVTFPFGRQLTLFSLLQNGVFSVALDFYPPHDFGTMPRPPPTLSALALCPENSLRRGPLFEAFLLTRTPFFFLLGPGLSRPCRNVFHFSPQRYRSCFPLTVPRLSPLTPSRAMVFSCFFCVLEDSRSMAVDSSLHLFRCQNFFWFSGGQFDRDFAATPPLLLHSAQILRRKNNSRRGVMVFFPDPCRPVVPRDVLVPGPVLPRLDAVRTGGEFFFTFCVFFFQKACGRFYHWLPRRFFSEPHFLFFARTLLSPNRFLYHKRFTFPFSAGAVRGNTPA